jgi:hypothetical protein
MAIQSFFEPTRASSVTGNAPTERDSASYRAGRYSANPTIFKLDTLRRDVLKGAMTEASFPADFDQIVQDSRRDKYTRADLFFANTYPTHGLKSLLANVCHQLRQAAWPA